MYMYICICIYSEHNEDEDSQKTVTNSLIYFRPVGWHKMRRDAGDRRSRERAERSKTRRVVLEAKQDDFTQIAYDMAIESDNWKVELRSFKRSRKGGHLATLALQDQPPTAEVLYTHAFLMHVHLRPHHIKPAIGKHIYIYIYIRLSIHR